MFFLSSVNNAVQTTDEVSNLTVILMGLGIVFIGLLIIIFVCKIMGLIVGGLAKKDSVTASDDVSSAPVQKNHTASPIKNRGEVTAAISAAVAESLGKDISAIRIHSIKKI